MLNNAQGRHAWAAVALFAFAEASFFPIPADVMVLPMMLADRKRVFRLGAWVAFWSVVGGMLGYAIGALFWETAGLWLIHALHIPLAKVEALRAKYSQQRLSDHGAGRDAHPLQAGDHRLGPGGRRLSAVHALFGDHPQLRYIVIEGAAGAFLRRTGPGAAREISRSWR